MIEFTRKGYDDVVTHADAGGAEEVCGVLAGDYGTESVVEETVEAENVAETPRTRYRIDPAELLAIIERIEEGGQDVVGFYHSHPSGPTHPSETDTERATWPDRSYVVCALDGQPFVGSWRYRDDTEAFEQEIVAVR